MATKKKTENIGRPVIVTTAHRGVFFGYAKDTSGETIKLLKSRLCVYWSSDCKGFMGLASNGPTKNCRIGPPADVELRNITSVIEVSPEAEQAWLAGAWG
jgi:hypothetical protein